MDDIRICGLADAMPLGMGLCKFPGPAISWTIAGSLPGLTDDEFQAAVAEAFDCWEDVCYIRPRYQTNARTANIVIGTGKIDGPNGTLAWSEMPCGGAVRLTQRYDTGELRWVVSETPGRGELDIVRVICHELGHALGIPHHRQGLTGLMSPMYSVSIRRPMKPDIVEAVERYGPPVATPPVPVPPAPPVNPNPGGGTVPNEDLLRRINFVLATLATLAKFTASDVDDRLVAVLKNLAAQPWFLHLLGTLLDQATPVASIEELVLVIQKCQRG